MAVIKQALFKADEVQPCGEVYDEEMLKHMAEHDVRFRYEPEERILYAFIEVPDNP